MSRASGRIRAVQANDPQADSCGLGVKGARDIIGYPYI